MKLRPLVILAAVLLSAAALWAAFDAAMTPPPTFAASLLPPGALLTIESPDFAGLLSDWNSSTEKRAWLASDDYAVFSRSHLFSQLASAQSEFAQAAGLPPNMQLLSQIAGKHSIFGWYNIGKLQFLYLSQMPSSRFSQSRLWQSRASFEQREAGGFPFYLRTNPQSGRTICFAFARGWVVLATRQDLMAEALALIGGAHNRSVADSGWYTQAVHAAGKPGDLRMVLNLKKIVLSPYFRSYWIQQNITAMSHYRAAVSDLFRSPTAYREERVLLPVHASPALPANSSAASLTGLVPADAAFYRAVAAPTPQQVVSLLRKKLLDPESAVSQDFTYAPAVSTSTPTAGNAADLQTRIDQAPVIDSTAGRWQPLETLCSQSQIVSTLQVETSLPGANGVFTIFPTAIVLRAQQALNASDWQSAINAALAPQLTAGQLGLSWQQDSGYWHINGVFPLFLAIKNHMLILSNSGALLKAILQQTGPVHSGPSDVTYAAGFNHALAGASFVHVTSILDHTNQQPAHYGSAGQPPAFFSGNIASLSSMFSAVQSESIQTRNNGNVVTQAVTYTWKQ